MQPNSKLKNTEKLKLYLILILFVFCGCAGGSGGLGPGQLATKSIETRYIDADFNTAYRAATHAFFALGFTISHSDKAGGIIVGKKEKTDQGAAFLAGLAFGVFALMGDYTDVTTITLFLEEGKDDKRTTLRIQMVVEEEAKIDPAVIDPIWIIAQREAMLIKGVNIPKELEEKFKALESPPEQKTTEEDDYDN